MLTELRRAAGQGVVGSFRERLLFVEGAQVDVVEALAIGDEVGVGADPDALRPDYASFDHLHPNDAGMTAIAQAIDPATLAPAPEQVR